MSQSAFARDLGICPSRVCQIEGGRGTFRPATIVEICERFRKEMGIASVTALDFSRIE